ncbi:MAG: hypothetical protein K0R85_183 [Devosia sp.]|jgi:hypothetical protein|nr:hypothetical protein [Devosia sp.]
MALKTILDNLDDVPDALKSEYKEVDGKFVLDIEGIDAHPAVVNLKTAHERQKTANKTLQTDLAAAKARLEGLPDDFDADAYEALQAQAEGKAPAKTDEQVAQVRQQLERKHQGELAKKDERIATLEGAVTKATIDDGLSKALDEAGVDPAFKPGAMALLKSKGAVKLVEEDGTFKATVETDMGPMPLASYVKDWSGSDEGKIYVKKPTGGDASGGQGNRFTDNPWDTSNGKRPNLTKQQELIASNDAKARQMAQAAGVTPNW